MEIKTAINLVGVWRKKWPEREQHQTHEQMVMISLVKEIIKTEAYRLRAEEAERHNSILRDKLSAMRDVLIDT